MNCIIYVRSLNTDAGRQSNIKQLESCRKYAIANNYNIIDEYTDLGKTSDDRIEYGRMLSNVREKQIKIILMYSGDRATRYKNGLNALWLCLKKYNVKIIWVGEESGLKAA